MYQEDLTAETLFNEPQFVERYLEMLTEETSTPYIERLRRNKQFTDFTDETLEVVKLLDGRESQIRLLINYLSLIIENCQDKMVTQTDTIEQQERDIEVLKVENSSMKEELKLFRSSLEELRQKHSTMEGYLEDVEKRYENDKVIFNQTQLEIQILKGIKDELTESRVENSKLEKINEGLKENLHNVEEKLELLRVENSDLKENFEVLKHNLGKSVHLTAEYEKIKSLYEKICKEQEHERSTFVNERMASEENLGLVSQKCVQLQEELQKAQSLASQKSIKRFNTVEDPALNLNVRLNHKFYSEPSIEGSIVLDHDRASASRAEASFPSTDDTLENYAADQFDGIRTTPNKDASGHKKAKQGLTAQKFNTVEARGCYPIEETSPTRMSDLGSLEEERTSRSTVPNHLKPKRKNILEEFFLLIESSKLFDEVNKQDIPYFQWAKWLENKLQSVYNETILPKRKVSKVTKALVKQGSKKKVMAA